jgi:predicted AlkP superfamily pyrophosphatase or phosphodiesterase
MNRLLSLLLAALTLGACTAPRPTTGGTGGVNRAGMQGKPYVVLVSFDGFRADYLDRYPAPNFQRVVRRGVRAEGLVPIFPSKTFPNHYSIVTGLYAEHHGLVANWFYDPVRGETYAMSNRAVVMDGDWYRGEPIWVTAERQGMVAASSTSLK